MEKEALEFISKMHVEGKSSHPIVRKLAKITVGLIVLIFLFTIWIDGFSTKMITSNLVTILLLSYVMNVTKPVAGYKSTVVKIELGEEDIIISYDGLDREDKMGPRIEKTTILYKNITKLEYSKPLQCLNIQGFPIESTQYLKQSNKREFTKNYFDKKEEKRTVLYVSGEEKEKIVNILEQKTGKKISFLD